MTSTTTATPTPDEKGSTMPVSPEMPLVNDSNHIEADSILEGGFDDLFEVEALSIVESLEDDQSSRVALRVENDNISVDTPIDIAIELAVDDPNLPARGRLVSEDSNYSLGLGLPPSCRTAAENDETKNNSTNPESMDPKADSSVDSSTDSEPRIHNHSQTSHISAPAEPTIESEVFLQNPKTGGFDAAITPAQPQEQYQLPESNSMSNNDDPIKLNDTREETEQNQVEPIIIVPPHFLPGSHHRRHTLGVGMGGVVSDDDNDNDDDNDSKLVDEDGRTLADSDVYTTYSYNDDNLSLDQLSPSGHAIQSQLDDLFPTPSTRSKNPIKRIKKWQKKKKDQAAKNNNDNDYSPNFDTQQKKKRHTIMGQLKKSLVHPQPTLSPAMASAMMLSKEDMLQDFPSALPFDDDPSESTHTSFYVATTEQFDTIFVDENNERTMIQRTDTDKTPRRSGRSSSRLTKSENKNNHDPDKMDDLDALLESVKQDAQKYDVEVDIDDYFHSLAIQHKTIPTPNSTTTTSKGGTPSDEGGSLPSFVMQQSTTASVLTPYMLRADYNPRIDYDQDSLEEQESNYDFSESSSGGDYYRRRIVEVPPSDSSNSSLQVQKDFLYVPSHGDLPADVAANMQMKLKEEDEGIAALDAEDHMENGDDEDEDYVSIYEETESVDSSGAILLTEAGLKRHHEKHLSQEKVEPLTLGWNVGALEKAVLQMKVQKLQEKELRKLADESLNQEVAARKRRCKASQGMPDGDDNRELGVLDEEQKAVETGVPDVGNEVPNTPPASTPLTTSTNESARSLSPQRNRGKRSSIKQLWKSITHRDHQIADLKISATSFDKTSNLTPAELKQQWKEKERQRVKAAQKEKAEAERQEMARIEQMRQSYLEEQRTLEREAKERKAEEERIAEEERKAAEAAAAEAVGREDPATTIPERTATLTKAAKQDADEDSVDSSLYLSDDDGSVGAQQEGGAEDSPVEPELPNTTAKEAAEISEVTNKATTVLDAVQTKTSPRNSSEHGRPPTTAVAAMESQSKEVANPLCEIEPTVPAAETVDVAVTEASTQETAGAEADMAADALRDDKTETGKTALPPIIQTEEDFASTKLSLTSAATETDAKAKPVILPTNVAKDSDRSKASIDEDISSTASKEAPEKTPIQSANPDAVAEEKKSEEEEVTDSKRTSAFIATAAAASAPAENSGQVKSAHGSAEIASSSSQTTITATATPTKKMEEVEKESRSSLTSLATIPVAANAAASPPIFRKSSKYAKRNSRRKSVVIDVDEVSSRSVVAAAATFDSTNSDQPQGPTPPPTPKRTKIIIDC